MKKLFIINLLLITTRIMPMQIKHLALAKFLRSIAYSGKRVDISLVKTVLRYPELVAALNTAAQNGAIIKIAIPETNDCYDES